MKNKGDFQINGVFSKDLQIVFLSIQQIEISKKMENQKGSDQQNNQKREDEQKPLPTSEAIPEITHQTSNANPRQVGLAKFKERFSLKKKKEIIDKRKEGIFQADNWFIGTSYYRQQWNQLFPNIESATCSSIVVQFDVCQDILLDFSRPKFIQLKELTLIFNTIKNMEAVNFINAPVLQTLNLQGNEVTNTKTLNKLMFSKLQHLDLTKNFAPIINACGLKTYNPQFALDFLIHERDRQIQTIYFYAKMEKKKQTQSFKSMMNSFSGLKYSYAIPQKKLCKTLQKKFDQ